LCGAELRAGFEIVSEAIGLAAVVQEADVVVTGEGRLDAQTLEGKAPAGVAQLARRYGKPVHAIVGCVDDSAYIGELFDSVLPLAAGAMAQTAAIANAPELLRQRARELAARLAS
jgi:glycerate kinase